MNSSLLQKTILFRFSKIHYW